METTQQQEQCQSFCQFNILDLFLEIAHESEDSSQQLDISESDFDKSKNNTLLQNYCQVKKQNIIKNILKSFQRYISDANREVQEELCQVAKKSYSFSQLKKLIKRNFKTFGKRWNMKLKYMVEKCSYKGLFEYYLVNKSSQWLDESRVQNKDDHKIVINFLIEAMKNPQYSDKIKFYKKQKLSTTSQ